jgi:putative peptide zinc metalloprotease protein
VSAPLLSGLWYRVAELKPRLRSHARMHRHLYRDEVWYLLQDAASGRQHRFTPAARLVISLMDGERTVEALWEIANLRLGEAAPTQDEMITLLGQLHSADLLQSDVTPDVAELFARGEREERARFRRSFANPMAIRIPLWDPDRFLNRFPRLIQLIWGPLGAIVWLAAVVPALFLIPPHVPELTNNFGDRVLASDNLLVLYLVFPILKAFHEMGHASATKAGGGEVHDIGVIFLVLLPVPYVEASASGVFRSKYRRALVGAAGMMVELFIAALAFYLWLMVEPGMLRAVLFNVMIIAGVSTLIFNGNPLLRYDAYYILADLIEIPNLAGRSARYWTYLLQRYGLGLKDIEAPHASRAEKAWFVFYGAASTIYRVIVTVLIALFIAGRFFFIGVLLALWAVFAMAVMPVLKGLRHIVNSPRLYRHRTRAIGVTLGGAALIGALVFLVPIPSHTQAEGVVWLSDQSLVRASVNGFVREVLVPPGTRVKAGDALVRCSNPTVETDLRVARARVTELEATLASEVLADRTRGGLARAKLDQERHNLAIAEERAAELITRAKTDGVFVVPLYEDMTDRYYHKGDLFAYVIGSTDQLVRVVVPQDAIDRVRVNTDRIRLRSVDHPETSLVGHIIRAVPGGDEMLPSRALGAEGGGEIATDPRDNRGVKALRRMFQFDVGVDAAWPNKHFGQRVYVRFEHEGEPLSAQWYRTIRLLFLSRFSV